MPADPSNVSPSRQNGRGSGSCLYYGDNLDVLPRIATESVDLIYLDPPFNSNATYNVLFRTHEGEKSQAQIEAFGDTWHWSQQAERQYVALITGEAPITVADALEAMHKLLGPNDMLAYLVMMTARLVELYRVLKPTGTLYLHCDPTASHYLKVILDSIFGPEAFVNEVIWKRTSAHNRTRRFGPIHDVILVYARGREWTWIPQHIPYDAAYAEANFSKVEAGTGRRYSTADLTSNNPGSIYEWKGMLPPGHRYWGVAHETMERLESEGRVYYTRNGLPRLKNYLDEMPGQLLQDVWTDLGPVHPHSKERLGYATQKPLSLLERIITASSNEGDVVLDPFCGCGTAVDAAQKLGRRWIGIDITYLAVDLIRKRMRHGYGDEIEQTYEVHGIPTDLAGAEALFNENPFDFERWAVSLVNGQPNEKQVGDKGIDGRIRFYAGKDKIGTTVVSVKGGRQVNPAMVQSLVGAMRQAKADMGLFIGMRTPTTGMREVADKSGLYTHPITGNTFPKVQIVTVADLLGGKHPAMPTAILPYIQAAAKPDSEAASMFQMAQ
jgi:DNA modification methylase